MGDLLERRYRLATSLHEGAPDGSAFDGVKKQIEIGPGSTAELCRIDGAGRIVRFWLTVPLIGRRNALTDVVVRMYWDDEEAPSVEVPIGDLFGASFGTPRRLVAERLVVDGGAYLSRFEMPFNTGARIELVNDSTQPVRDLFYQVGYYEEPQRKTPEATFHAQSRRQRFDRDEPSLVVLDVAGRGWFAGLTLDIQNHDWWLRPPFRQIALPRGFGLGLLEGWETMVIDGASEDAVVGTGAEDYFSGGFYFKGAPYCTPTHGCTYRSFLHGRVSAYRFHVDDPVPFNQSFEMRLDHGLKNSMSGSYRATAYWYQFEPHKRLPELPGADVRRPAAALINPIQWLLSATAAAVALGAVGYLLW